MQGFIAGGGFIDVDTAKDVLLHDKCPRCNVVIRDVDFANSIATLQSAGHLSGKVFTRLTQSSRARHYAKAEEPVAMKRKHEKAEEPVAMKRKHEKAEEPVAMKRKHKKAKVAPVARLMIATEEDRDYFKNAMCITPHYATYRRVIPECIRVQAIQAHECCYCTDSCPSGELVHVHKACMSCFINVSGYRYHSDNCVQLLCLPSHRRCSECGEKLHGGFPVFRGRLRYFCLNHGYQGVYHSNE